MKIIFKIWWKRNIYLNSSVIYLKPLPKQAEQSFFFAKRIIGEQYNESLDSTMILNMETFPESHHTSVGLGKVILLEKDNEVEMVTSVILYLTY